MNENKSYNSQSPNGGFADYPGSENTGDHSDAQGHGMPHTSGHHTSHQRPTAYGSAYPYTHPLSERSEAHTPSSQGFAFSTEGAGPYGYREQYGQQPQFASGGSSENLGQHRQPEKKTRRVSMTTLMAAVLAASLVGGATSAVTLNALDNEPTGSSALPALEAKPAATRNLQTDDSVQDVAAKVMPSVVTIQVRTANGGDKGSGSILSEDGTVITNNHVVADAVDGRGEITVGLNDGRVFPAEIVARDPETDIAVIRLKGAKDLTPISLGDSSQLKVGQEVVAIGSPLGLDATVTSGIVSAMNRPVQAGGRQGEQSSLIDAIQTDAPINPGNSGGALVDMDGNLIGIPSVIATLGGAPGASASGSIGLGFAIPINQARNIAEQLIKNGHVEHPIIGVTINPRADVRGASIVDVPAGSPADRAGLKKGDVVVKVDNRSVDSGIGLIAAIRSHKVGDEVKLDIVDSEGGNPHTVTLKLAPEGSRQG